jgi:DNA (cytosine-5)-methyltransferase 1
MFDLDRFLVWENVPELSPRRRRDFRAVLENLQNCRQLRICTCPPSGLEIAGAILGDQFSLAWRGLDAQYWFLPKDEKDLPCRGFAGHSAEDTF